MRKVVGTRTTVISKNCELISVQQKCCTCKHYKKTLTAMMQKVKHRERGPTTTYASMNRNELSTALKESKQVNRQLKRELKQMQGQISRETNRHGINLDTEQSEEFRSVIDRFNEEVTSSFDDPEDPKLLLWKQHHDNMQKTSPKHQRWHPLVLKWCIGLHHKSPSAYEFIRESGLISLPHRTTLKKYTNFTSPTPGYNPEIIEHVIEQTLKDLPPEEDFKRNVTLIFDEVKIKSGLVYKASSGKLIGYTDVGEVNNELTGFSRRVANSGKSTPPELATHVLSVMVRGIFSPLHTSIGYFPTSTASGDQLYNIIWDGVETLHTVGFRVRAFIADGASTNRKFFKMHSSDRHRLTYATRNRYSHESRDVFFICDAPHLMKTIRNNWENSGCNSKTRTLMVSRYHDCIIV